MDLAPVRPDETPQVPTILAVSTGARCRASLGIVAGPGGMEQRHWNGSVIDKITDQTAYAVAASRHLIVVAHRENVAIAAPERPAHRLVRPLASPTVPTAVTTDRSGTAFAVGHADGSLVGPPLNGATDR